MTIFAKIYLEIYLFSFELYRSGLWFVQPYVVDNIPHDKTSILFYSSHCKSNVIESAVLFVKYTNTRVFF